MGYEYWPLAEGTLTLTNSKGDTVQELTVASVTGTDSDCGTGIVDVEYGFPPHWSVGNEPTISCGGKPEPYVNFWLQPDRETQMNWPEEAGTYRGRFSLDPVSVEMSFDVEIEEDRGELTPLPKDGKTQGLEPTTADYYRRYRITAEIDCAEGNLPCEGTWNVDVVYDQPRDRVSWLYPVEL
jgi:hypothetical protein